MEPFFPSPPPTFMPVCVWDPLSLIRVVHMSVAGRLIAGARGHLSVIIPLKGMTLSNSPTTMKYQKSTGDGWVLMDFSSAGWNADGQFCASPGTPSMENCGYSDLTNAMAVLLPEDSSPWCISPSPGSYTSSALSSEMVPEPQGNDAAVTLKAECSSIPYSLHIVSYRFPQ